MANLRKSVCLSLAALVLGSCTLVDKFSGRAVDYNLEAEAAQMQALLLNIVRASLKRPMQFTTLSTITGTASESGNTTLSLPFGEAQHRPKTTSSPDVFGLSGTISGGPTFTVPVLDTQEFYQGELKPLTGQEYRFFLDEGLTPAVLFYLIIDNIELTVVDPTVPASQKNTLPKFTFRNYVGDDFDFDQFAAVADYLLGLGITLEEAKELQPVGPELTAAKLGDLKAVVDLTNAGLKIMPVQKIVGGGTGATAKATAAKPKPVAAARTTGLYQIEKETTVYRPCFEPPLSRRSDVDAALLCGSSTTESGGQTAGNLQSSGGFSAAALAPILQQIRADFIATHQPGSTTSSEIARLPNLPPGKKLQLRLYTRSTEAILRQLGSIVARDLYPSFDGRRVIQVKVGEPYLPYPPDPCPKTSNPDAPKPIGAGYRCENLFVLALDTRSANSPLSVDYDGKTYLVPGDSQVAGRTMGLLDLAKQLLALHTAAKELPASNVLNVIGGTP